ncbi:MAG: YHS domain-containing protein [Armatimonadota bacterium]
MRTTVAALLLVALAALVFAGGCSKTEQTQLQGAPSVAQPPTAATPEALKTAKPAADQAEMAVCPVLGTTMPKDKMTPYEYKGKTYYLCCADCLPKFKANPEKYLKNPAKPLPVGAPMPAD